MPMKILQRLRLRIGGHTSSAYDFAGKQRHYVFDLIAVGVSVSEGAAAEHTENAAHAYVVARFLHYLPNDCVFGRLPEFDPTGRKAPRFTSCFLLQKKPSILIMNHGGY